MSAARVGRGQWAVHVARIPVDAAGRLVVGQLLDRAARDGRVRATTAELAQSCCLGVTQIANVLALLAAQELLGQDKIGYLLTRPCRTGLW